MSRRIAMINTLADNMTAPARIMHAVARCMADSGNECLVAYGRGECDTALSKSLSVRRIGTDRDVLSHYLFSCVDDSEGLHSRRATQRFMRFLEAWNPDVVHLHNLHGHYLHVPTLIEGLARMDVPVVITVHDSWLFTGHCPLYTHVECDKWKSGCKGDCPGKTQYPYTFLSRADLNLELKSRLLHSLRDVTLVAVSDWMHGELQQSLLSDLPSVVVTNGVDTGIFSPSDKRPDNMILAVANRWTREKGLDDLCSFARDLREDEQLVVVGRGSGALKGCRNVQLLPNMSPDKLANLYRKAKVYVTPTRGESFGMTTVEALACGTPVVAYPVGALNDIVKERVGVLTREPDPSQLREAIDRAVMLSRSDCANYAVSEFPHERMLERYSRLLTDKIRGKRG